MPTKDLLQKFTYLLLFHYMYLGPITWLVHEWQFWFSDVAQKSMTMKLSSKGYDLGEKNGAFCLYLHTCSVFDVCTNDLQ